MSMTGFMPSSRLPGRKLPALLPVVVTGLALAGLVAAPLAAQPFAYARTASNDMGQCAPGKGPAVRVVVSGLKSSTGNLFVRAYPANSRDWLESKRYIMRVDVKPQTGSVTVCVPLPATGDYAIAVHHDVNGNRKSDLSDGAGMSNNPGIRKILGLVPRPPSVDKVRFNAGSGVTRMAISMQYM
jgi:uncharacterized protein (DUF2141 family)